MDQFLSRQWHWSQWEIDREGCWDKDLSTVLYRKCSVEFKQLFQTLEVLIHELIFRGPLCYFIFLVHSISYFPQCLPLPFPSSFLADDLDSYFTEKTVKWSEENSDTYPPNQHRCSYPLPLFLLTGIGHLCSWPTYLCTGTHSSHLPKELTPIILHFSLHGVFILYWIVLKSIQICFDFFLMTFFHGVPYYS